MFSVVPVFAQLSPRLVPPPPGQEWQREARKPASPPVGRDSLADPLRNIFDAHGIAANRHTEEAWKTSWGSYDRSYERMWQIVARVTPWPAAPSEVDVECIWFGRSPVIGAKRPKTERVILSRETQKVQVAPNGKPTDIVFHSGFALSRVQKYVALGESRVSGQTIEGWYVRLIVAGVPTRDIASSPYLVDVARSPSEMAQLRTIKHSSSPSPPAAPR